MPRKGHVKKRPAVQDSIFGSPIVGKFINCVMLDGKKSTAERIVYDALAIVGDKDHTIVLEMRHVPTIDATGLVALESVLDRLFRSKVKVIFAGLTPEVLEIFERAGIKRDPGRLAYAPDVETAISMAIVHAARLSGAVQDAA